MLRGSIDAAGVIPVSEMDALPTVAGLGGAVRVPVQGLLVFGQHHARARE